MRRRIPTRKVKKAVSLVGDLSHKNKGTAVLARLITTVALHLFSLVPVMIIIMIKIVSSTNLELAFIILLPLNTIMDPVIYTLSSSSVKEKIKTYIK